MTDIVLHQFPYSHFNDKVRWALDYKGLPHTKKSYLPGPHMPVIKRLSGQSRTPVLEWQNEITAGSAEIIDRLEREHPSNPLYPYDVERRKEALAFQERFDREVGPATRAILFEALITEGAYICRMFSTGKPLPVRALYRLTFPLARGMIARGNGINDKNIAQSKVIVEKALMEIEDKIATTGYIVGDNFTVADLTAAALFAPLANPQHPEMARPTPIPESVASVINSYKGYKTIGWVKKMYEAHRPV